MSHPSLIDVSAVSEQFSQFWLIWRCYEILQELQRCPKSLNCRKCMYYTNCIREDVTKSENLVGFQNHKLDEMLYIYG